MVDTGIILILVLIFNLWWVTLLFHKLHFLEYTDTIITSKFWRWYLVWWFLWPYELYKMDCQVGGNSEDIELNNV